MSHPSIEDILQRMVDNHINLGSDSESDEVFYRDKAKAVKALQERESRIIAEAKIDELNKWLSMVSWPNNYQAMRKDMEERIKQLKGKD